VTLIVREAGLQMRKNPALLTDRGEVRIIINTIPSSVKLELAKEVTERQTGYRLIVDA